MRLCSATNEHKYEPGVKGRRMSHNQQIEDAPPWNASVRISASLEPEATRMLNELARRLYPDRRVSQARTLVIEQAVRAMHRRVIEADPGKQEG